MLNVASPNQPSFENLDADAVGVHLASVLQDRPSAELAAICARIATRFKEVRGDPQAMREFMYTHLQVSTETQDGVASVELDGIDETTLGAPPPPIVVGTDTAHLVEADVSQ